jgi:hypothetical protein
MTLHEDERIVAAWKAILPLVYPWQMRAVRIEVDLGPDTWVRRIWLDEKGLLKTTPIQLVDFYTPDI